MTKSRIALIALSVCCIALLAAGTAAYFTVQDTALNVITSGTLEMTLEERANPQGLDLNNPQQPVDLSALPEFKDVIGVMPGEQVSKIVYVTNHGSADFYARIKLDVTIAGENDASLPVQDGGVDMVALDINTADWTYKDGWYYCNQPVTANALANTHSPLLFTTVSFAPEMGNEYQNATVTINVTAEAVQSRNNGANVSEAIGWPTAD